MYIYIYIYIYTYSVWDCCQAYSCITGNSTGCESCVDQNSRTTDAHCAFCNSGYHLSLTQVHTSKDGERIWSTICKAHVRVQHWSCRRGCCRGLEVTLTCLLLQALVLHKGCCAYVNRLQVLGLILGRSWDGGCPFEGARTGYSQRWPQGCA